MIAIREEWFRRLLDTIQSLAASGSSPSDPRAVLDRIAVVGFPATTLERLLFSSLLADLANHVSPISIKPLITSYSRLALTDQRVPFPPRSEQRYYRLAYQAKTIIERDLSKPLRVSALARQLGIHRNVLAREFRKLFGVSVRAYITRARIDAASDLLLTTDEKIASVGAAVGFSDRSAFSSCYRRVIGVSPARARTAGMRAIGNTKLQKCNTDLLCLEPGKSHTAR